MGGIRFYASNYIIRLEIQLVLDLKCGIIKKDQLTSYRVELGDTHEIVLKILNSTNGSFHFKRPNRKFLDDVFY